MTTSTTLTEIRTLPLAALRLSQTRAQIERRAHLNKDAIAELAESIRSVGVVQPILVRPAPAESDAYEIVAGERRYLAAKQAGLAEIPASIRQLNDEQVLELQLVENLQRQDLHELAEAEGYEALLKLGWSVEQIAAKVGKSIGTVYARMRLLALCKEARKAFYDGRLNASTALLLARIPVESLQKQALKEITQVRWGGSVMSYREALETLGTIIGPEEKRDAIHLAVDPDLLHPLSIESTRQLQRPRQ